MTCSWLLLSPERLICQCRKDRASETTTAQLISGFWIPSMGSRIQQVMSPTTAHLPSRPFTLHSTLRTHFLINCLLLLGLSSGMSPVTVSLLPIAMAITVADFCQCLSLHHCHCRTFTLLLAQLSNKPFLFSLIFSCMASCISSLMQLAFPSGSQKGVGGKRRSGSPFLPFALPCCQIPTAGGYPFLGFTPCPRPRVRGPAPYLLTKLGFLPSFFHGVGEKTASRAVSLLSLFCLLLFLFVFAQTRTAQVALHLLKPLQGVEPKERVLFCHCFAESLSRNCFTHSDLGKDSNLTSAQVCARDLSRREWNLSCQLSSMGPADPSLPVFCYYFTDISLFEFHSSLPILPGVATMDLANPFSASNFANLTCKGSLPDIAGLSASICLSFSLTLCASHPCEGSFPQIGNLSPIEGALCLPFSPSNCVTHCSDPIDGKPVYQPIGFCLYFACGDSPLHFAYLRLKNGSLIAPFSASNVDTLCRDSVRGLCHHQAYSLSASVCLTSCVSHHCEGSVLPIFHLSSAYGPSQRPFSVTNFAIRGSTCPPSRLSPEIEGFCQQFVALSSLCGGSIPPTQFWSSNSSTLGLGGRFPPLHSSNCVSVCTSFLYIGSGAYICVGTDDSVIRSPLPITCIHSMSWISAPLPLHSSTCMLSIDFSMMYIGSGAYFCGGTDDFVIKSPLPITCTQSMPSIFAPLPPELLPCYMSIDLTMGSRNSVADGKGKNCTEGGKGVSSNEGSQAIEENIT